MSTLSPELLNKLVCPCCQSSLTYDKAKDCLVCEHEQLIFTHIDGIFQLRPDDAIPMHS